MGRITIRLTGNPRTGKKDLVIEYQSDPDRTLVEHEKRHRQIVEQLIGGGVLSLGELGEVRVERAPVAEPEVRREEEWEEAAESESGAERYEG